MTPGLGHRGSESKRFSTAWRMQQPERARAKNSIQDFLSMEPRNCAELYARGMSGMPRGKPKLNRYFVLAFALDLPAQFDDDAATGDIDCRHHGVGKRQQHGWPLRRRDFDDVAGAEIVD